MAKGYLFFAQRGEVSQNLVTLVALPSAKRKTRMLSVRRC